MDLHFSRRQMGNMISVAVAAFLSTSTASFAQQAAVQCKPAGALLWVDSCSSGATSVAGSPHVTEGSSSRRLYLGAPVSDR
jgi:hypothetical protein